MNQLMHEYFERGGKITVVKPRIRRYEKTCRKKDYITCNEIKKVVKRIFFLGKIYLRQVK